MIRHRKVLIAWLLVSVLLLTNQNIAANYANIENSSIAFAEKFYRTELYFGMDKPKGGEVTEEDWNKFLETEITPRFPNGLTVLEGYGQFKDSAGKIERENSRVLILLYAKKDRQTANRKIEEIRTAYKKQFEQESVLRIDFPKAMKIMF
jgi:hypothetical protein